MVDDDSIDRLALEALEALERMHGEGPAVLDEVCHRHPEPAARIRATIAALDEFGLLDDAPIEVDPELNEPFGDYVLLRRLGGGGMGTVFLAEQTSLGRQVALKVIRAYAVGSETVRARPNRTHRRPRRRAALDRHRSSSPVGENQSEGGRTECAVRST